MDVQVPPTGTFVVKATGPGRTPSLATRPTNASCVAQASAGQVAPFDGGTIPYHRSLEFN